MESLEDGDLISLTGQVAGAGKSRRAGAYNSHLMAVGLGGLGKFLVLIMVTKVVVVGHKTLQASYSHGLALNTADTFGLALGFLGADPAADGGQGVGGGNDAIGLLKFALGNFCDEFRYTDVYRAAGYTGFMFTLEAAFSLVNGGFGTVTQSHFLEIFIANQWLLFRHGILLRIHISHGEYLLSGDRRVSWPLSPLQCKNCFS